MASRREQLMAQWAARQNNTRGMGLARDVRAGQAQGWKGRGPSRRMVTQPNPASRKYRGRRYLA